jgi:hypothetical protein
VDRTTVEQLLEAAGPGGRLTIRFRDRVVPQLDANGEAVHEEFPDGSSGAVIHVVDPVGIARTMSAFVVQIIDNHVALGTGPGQPIERLVAFDDIEAVRPDPADHDAVVIRAGTPAPPVQEPAITPEPPAPGPVVVP